MKCQICKNNPVLWAWQPLGPAENADCFTSLGYHYRGFPVIKICHECYGKLKIGGHITFTYKNTAYAGTIHNIEPLTEVTQ